LTRAKILAFLPAEELGAAVRDPVEASLVASRTTPSPFHRAPSDDVSVPTMNTRDVYGMAAGDGYVAVELPYANHDMTMLIVMPPLGTLDAFVSGLDAQALGGRSDGRPGHRAEHADPGGSGSPVLVLHPRCTDGRCAVRRTGGRSERALTRQMLGSRTQPGGDLHDQRFRWVAR
jgi:hypothetical protein